MKNRNGDIALRNNMKDNKIVIYQAKNGAIKLHKDLNKETIWATQKQIATVFDIDRSVITKHIRNIYNDKELNKNSVCAFFAHTAEDCKKYINIKI